MPNEIDYNINFDEAEELKKLGFNELCSGCFHYYLKDFIETEMDNSNDRGYLASPTYNQAFAWFFKTFKLKSGVWFDGVTYCYEIKDFNINEWIANADGIKSFGNVELGCLRELIKIVKYNEKEKN